MNKKTLIIEEAGAVRHVVPGGGFKMVPLLRGADREILRAQRRDQRRAIAKLMEKKDGL